MAVKVLDFMVRGTAPDQDIGALAMVIKTGQVIRIIKGIIMARAVSRIIKVVTIIRVISSRAKGIIIVREISSNSVSNNSSRLLDIRVIRRN